MNTAQVISLFAGGVGSPLGKVAGGLPCMARMTQLGCAITLLGRPISVIFMVFASAMAANAWVSTDWAASQVSGGNIRAAGVRLGGGQKSNNFCRSFLSGVW